jgi:uncharacterized protein
MIVVSDTSPITNLAAVGLLDLLHQLYDRVIIPQAVYDEMASFNYSVPGALEVQTLSWINSQPVADIKRSQELQIQLDIGEAEAIILALELQADLLLIDERKGRKVAAQCGVKKINGLLGVLLEAKQKKLLPEIKPIMDALIDHQNFRISDRLYRRVLYHLQKVMQQ